MRSCSRSAAGRLRDGRAPAWRRGRCRRRRGLKPAHVAAGGKREGRAQQDGRSPKAAAHPGLVPSRARVIASATRSLSSELILAEQFNLSHPEHLDSRPAPRLDPAADANSSIFERLKVNSGSLERRHHAP